MRLKSYRNGQMSNVKSQWLMVKSQKKVYLRGLFFGLII